MMKVLAKLELLLVGAWLGAAAFFSFGVAPSSFAVLPSAELAGNVVNRTLMIINMGGLVIGLLTLASSFLPREYPNPVWAWGRRFLLLIFAAACGVGQFGIAFWLAFLRLQMGKPVEQLAKDDPLRIQFDQLHQASVWVLVTGMVAALLVFFVMSKSGASKAAKTKVDPDFDFSKELNF